MQIFENPLLRFFASVSEKLISFGGSFQSLFLLWMRLTWGHQFYLLGSDLLSNVDKSIVHFITLNVPAPTFHVYFVGYTEVICGILMMIGLASRLSSLFLIYITISALAIAHSPALIDFQFITDPSLLVIEPPYPYLITSILVLCFGPGKVSLDGWIKRWADRQPKF